MISLSHYRSCCLAVSLFTACAAVPVTAQNAAVALPYEMDFEASDGYAVGPLLTDSQWNLDAGLDAEVFSFGAFGDQSIGFTGSRWLWLNSLGLTEGDVTWVDFYLKPVFAEVENLPQGILSEQSAVTGFAKVASTGEVFAVDGDGAGSGAWVPSGAQVALNGRVAQDWMRLTYRLDYATKQWDLFVDGQMALTDLGFLDDAATKLTEFAARGDLFDASVFDYFYAGGENPLYQDTSSDGLPDAWLIAQGLSIYENQREGDGDLDGLDNLTEFRFSTRADLADTDSDGADDGVEIANAIDPNDPDTDDDGALDGIELANGIDPKNPDTDNDGAQDGPELAVNTDPLSFDTDGDGLADSLEAVWSLDPLVQDLTLANLSETTPGSGVFEWSTSFSQSEAYVDGALNGQQSWSTVGDVAIAAEQIDVTDLLTTDASFERLAGIGETRQIWVSFRAKLLVGKLPDMSALAEPVVAIWGAADPHELSIWDEASLQWVPYSVSADVSEWNHYALYLDYVEQEWLLTQNGVLIASGLSFQDKDLIVFSRFKALQAQFDGTRALENGPIQASFDDFVFSTAEPANLDYDGDGLLNSIEQQVGTDVYQPDTDSDGIDDFYEYENGLNPFADDATDDLDGDELSNRFEYSLGTSAASTDTDADGILDFDEVNLIGSDPLADNASQYAPLSDFSFRGINPGLECNAYQDTGENPHYYMSASGLGIYENWDSGHYVHQTVDGDFSFTVQLHKMEGGTRPQVSLLARESYSAFSNMGALVRENVERYYRLYQRGLEADNPDLITGKLNFQYANGQSWLRLVRRGTTLYSYASQDGITWSLVGTTIAPAIQSLKLGVFASSGTKFDRTFVEFSVVELLTDFDQDGLWDSDELTYGTSATEADSDGDGYSDYEEIYDFYSDPLVADLNIAQIESSSLGASGVADLGSWGIADSSIFVRNVRGSATFNVTVDQDAIFRLRLDAESRYNLTSVNHYSIKVKVDDVYIGRISMDAYEDISEFGTIMTPWLKAGEHTVEFYVDNTYTRRSFQINGFDLEYVGGVDADLDAIPDWMQTRLAANNAFQLEATSGLVQLEGVAPGNANAESQGQSFEVNGNGQGQQNRLKNAPDWMQTLLLLSLSDGVDVYASQVSPVCLEGYSRYLAFSTMENSTELQPLPDYGWYANLPLIPEQLVTADFSFENGGLTQIASFVWEATDVLTAEDRTLRVGDSLLLTAYDDTRANNQNVEITIDQGAPVIGTEETPVQHTFTAPGTYTVEASVGNFVGSFIVTVLEADLGEDLYLTSNQTYIWSPPFYSEGSILEFDAHTIANEKAVDSKPAFDLTIPDSEVHYIASRVATTGAVLDHIEVQGFYLYNASETLVEVIQTFDDGDFLVGMGLVLDAVPADIEVTVSIFVAGVTFADGSIKKILTADDFDELGRATLYFIKPKETLASICHRIQVKTAGAEPSGVESSSETLFHDE